MTRTSRFLTCSRLIAVLGGFLLVQNTAVSQVEESATTAVELLQLFAGRNADTYAPFFEYTNESRIIRVEIHAVGMENTTAKYTSVETPWHEVNNILRITTADGYEGISGVDTYYQGGFSDQHLRELERMVSYLATAKSLDPVKVSLFLDTVYPTISDTVRASVDIALWDLAATKAGKPLYEMFGASRDSLPAYASLPFYESLPEYTAAVETYAELGFRHFKFHVWGSIEEDLRLVELMQKTFAESGYRFMVDLEGLYDFNDAARLGKEMEQGLFFWFEAPINDELLEQYSELRNLLSLQIIPAGYNIYSTDFIGRGIEAGAWDAGRFDATVVGGISATLARLIVANRAGLAIDVQSWGHSLAQAANLHLMLANEKSEYFEAPMPKEVFDFGMNNEILLVDGMAIAPAAPGLGISIDWGRLPTADFYVTSENDLVVGEGQLQ